ncbi:Protein of unknown function DUF91 [Collimonas sp. OK307]|uniref:endonuclease NucS domain-containing protein n=1 Tax=Collimonas sp. OK307 TaxID=1801620 RepID=UPI0008EF6932|nr:endonuclease NucS domain-containing protein [Collimonas sp. OK307]SFI02997.1 Protein of unknown function DUF91 [Collimonas sp. OK307]
MSRYAALTGKLLESGEQRIVLTFDELDAIVGGLPDSAKKYGAWWANKASSQPHSKFWLDAGRRASPDFRMKLAVFTQDDSIETGELAAAVVGESTSEVLTEYVESSLSLERDLEDHIVSHLETLEPGLKLVSRQETIEVGRLDLLAMDCEGRTVIIELKAGEAKDAAIGQIARYIGWFARRDKKPPRAILVAGAFSDPVRYSAMAIPGLKLVTYRVSFNFDEATI